MSDRRRAIVIGAGVAGVLVARVLADRFENVLVFDRDSEVMPRPHVPQMPHTHVLGAHGFRILSRLFEGFDADLAAAGAPLFDFGECPLYASRWTPRGSFGLMSRSCTRPLLETVLRRRLRAHPNVELVTGQMCRPILDKGRVTGVRLEGGRVIEADFVVAASGVSGKSPEWLVECGYPPPSQSELDIHGAVVSLLVRPAEHRNWIMLNVRRTPGKPPRWGVISRVEEGLWRVSMAGAGGLRPPRDLPTLLEFARAVTPPIIGELLEGAVPITTPSRYGNNRSHWVHYELMSRFPDGIVIVGDATFHPNYEHGQGMTFCAMTAELLGEHLDHHELGLRVESSREFQRSLATMLAPYWDWNLAVDVMPGVETEPVSRATRTRRRFYRWMRRAATYDAKLWKAVLEVTQSVRSPCSLLNPALLWRALDQRLHPPPNADVREYEWLMRITDGDRATSSPTA